MQEKLINIVNTINTYLSDYILIILLVSVGLYFTIRTRFVQVRCFGEGMKRVFGGFSFSGKKHGKSGMSSFQALATAISAQVGTGNIVGACGAILIGGPGAIFWMWVIAFFGMATIYAEAVLAQKTKTVTADGEAIGGPVYYIREAFKGKFGKILAVCFSFCVILALGFMGAMVQSNSIGEACNTAFGIPTWVCGLIIAAAAGLIFIGGIQRIASVSEKIVPIMACLYLIGSLVVICANITRMPEAFALIFKYAFQPNAIIGGGIAYALKEAISQGAKRGLFSNEAGMGSTPHAHAVAKVEKPHDQGVVAMIGVFIDTFIVLTLTALAVIVTMYTEGRPLAGGYTGKITEVLTKTNLAQTAFGTVMGEHFGNAFVAICLLFFAFTTIVGWYFFGKQNMVYLFGKKSLIPYSVVCMIFIVLGSLASNDLVWGLTDLFNQLMVIPNVLALFALGGIVAAAAKSAHKKKDDQNK
ncbi:MAG: sodium:alanine symporter family protein [Clostridia bacterium]|nr:sodium:alanine symporter family protein [Clostridia bacterium]